MARTCWTPSCPLQQGGPQPAWPHRHDLQQTNMAAHGCGKAALSSNCRGSKALPSAEEPGHVQQSHRDRGTAWLWGLARFAVMETKYGTAALRDSMPFVALRRTEDGEMCIESGTRSKTSPALTPSSPATRLNLKPEVWQVLPHNRGTQNVWGELRQIQSLGIWGDYSLGEFKLGGHLPYCPPKFLRLRPLPSHLAGQWAGKNCSQLDEQVDNSNCATIFSSPAPAIGTPPQATSRMLREFYSVT